MYTCAYSSFPFSVKEAKPFIYIKAIVHGVGPLLGLVNLLKGRIDLGEPPNHCIPL